MQSERLELAPVTGSARILRRALTERLDHQRVDEQSAGDFALALMPGDKHQTLGFTKFYSITASAAADPARAEAAWKFVNFMAGKPYTVAQRWADEKGLGFGQVPLFDDPAVIAQALPVSLTLGGLAFCFALGLGIPWGVLMAIRRGQWSDHALGLVSLIAIGGAAFALTRKLA